MSLSVTAFLNLRMMSSGLSRTYTQPLGSLSDLDILLSGLVRDMIRAPTLGMKGSGSLNTSPYTPLKRLAMSRQISTCCFWSSPTGTRSAW